MTVYEKCARAFQASMSQEPPWRIPPPDVISRQSALWRANLVHRLKAAGEYPAELSSNETWKAAIGGTYHKLGGQ